MIQHNTIIDNETKHNTKQQSITQQNYTRYTTSQHKTIKKKHTHNTTQHEIKTIKQNATQCNATYKKQKYSSKDLNKHFPNLSLPAID